MAATICERFPVKDAAAVLIAQHRLKMWSRELFLWRKARALDVRAFNDSSTGGRQTARSTCYLSIQVCQAILHLLYEASCSWEGPITFREETSFDALTTDPTHEGRDQTLLRDRSHSLQTRARTRRCSTARIAECITACEAML